MFVRLTNFMFALLMYRLCVCWDLSCLPGECDRDLTRVTIRDPVHAYVGDDVTLLGYDTIYGSQGSVWRKDAMSRMYTWVFQSGPISYKLFCSERFDYDRTRFEVRSINENSRRYLTIFSIQLNQAGNYIWQLLKTNEEWTPRLLGEIHYRVYVHVKPTPLVTLSVQEDIEWIMDDFVENGPIVHIYLRENLTYVPVTVICPYVNKHGNFDTSDMYWMKLNDVNNTYITSPELKLNETNIADGDLWACGLQSWNLNGFISVIYVNVIKDCKSEYVNKELDQIVYIGQYSGFTIGNSIAFDGCERERRATDVDGLIVEEKDPCTHPNMIVVRRKGNLVCF